MSQAIAQTIDHTLELRPEIAERLKRMKDAYASVPDEKRDFYKFAFWMIATLHDVGNHVSSSPSATIRTRKQFADCANQQLSHFCKVLDFPRRNLAKLAEHIDKFISWFNAHGIELPKEDAQTLLGYIAKAENLHSALAEKESELNEKTGRHASLSQRASGDKE